MKKETKTGLIVITVIILVIAVTFGILANYGTIWGSQTTDIPKVEETKVEEQPKVEKTKTEIVQLKVEKEFTIRPATWVNDEEYLTGLNKLNSFSTEELKNLHLEGLEIVVDSDFSLQAGLLRIDYQASLGEIKEYIEKNASVARAEEEAEKVAAEKNTQLEKILRAKGLNISKTTITYQREYLIALEKLNTLTADEIKSMRIENNKIIVSWFFKAYSEDKEIRIDYKASLEEIKNFIIIKIEKMKEEQSKPKKELKEQIGKLEKEIKEKINK